MTKLSRAQRDLLTRAAAAETGDVESTEAVRPVASTLIKRGLMISIPQKDGSGRLLVTENGRASIGAPAAPHRKRASKTRAAATAGPTKKGKIPTLIDLLKQPDGATVAAMMEATGWQAHSVRGAMSGAIKKTLGLEVVSEKTDGGRVYRIASRTQV